MALGGGAGAFRHAAHEPDLVLAPNARHRAAGEDERDQAILLDQRQIQQRADAARQIAGGDRRIIGVMLESNLVPGAQKHVPGQPLVRGQSMTDACIGWDDTVPLLRELAAAVRTRG